jgi:predicted  nucleic acid-binding Zn-ribbon protein
LANPLTRSLAALFHSRADVTSLKRLAREGFRTVKVLDVEKLEEIVIEAVERVVRDLHADPASPDHVADGAQIELLKLLGNETRLGERNAQLTRAQRLLEGDLGRLQGELSESRKKFEASVERAGREAMEELREQLDAALAELFERARSDVEDFAPGAGGHVAALQAPLREAMLALLARALQRSRPETAGPSQVQVELLERRVQKLTVQLEETQELLARVRREGAADAEGVPSVHRTVQGLKGGEAAVEQRRALMREIFRHNLELRNSLQDAIPTPTDPKGGA